MQDAATEPHVQPAHTDRPSPSGDCSVSKVVRDAVDDDDVPTLRRIPAARQLPDLTQGAVGWDRDLGKWLAYAPGAVFLGSYSTQAHAQNRLDLWLGRPIRLAKSGTRLAPVKKETA